MVVCLGVEFAHEMKTLCFYHETYYVYDFARPCHRITRRGMSWRVRDISQWPSGDVTSVIFTIACELKSFRHVQNLVQESWLEYDRQRNRKKLNIDQNKCPIRTQKAMLISMKSNICRVNWSTNQTANLCSKWILDPAVVNKPTHADISLR